MGRPVNCQGSWDGWSECNGPCGGGVRERTFTIETPSSNGGVECSFGDGQKETQTCNTHACDVDCQGSWTEWSECVLLAVVEKKKELLM